jgi:hypothetical protein
MHQNIKGEGCCCCIIDPAMQCIELRYRTGTPGLACLGLGDAGTGFIGLSLSNHQTCEQTPDQAGRAYIQPSCQERKHPLGPMQELGAFACGPPVELLPTYNRCRLSQKAVTGVTLFRFGAPWSQIGRPDERRFAGPWNLVRRKKGSDHGPSCARNDF